jgi:hypothetical protein
MNQSVPDELISAYFDGELTPEERERVERLLESSSEHRQLLDDASKLSALLHSFPREAAPSKLASNVQKQIEAINSTRLPLPSVKRPGLRREWTAFAAGMMATMASLFVYVAANQSHVAPEGTKVASSRNARDATFESLKLPESQSRFGEASVEVADSYRSLAKDEALAQDKAELDGKSKVAELLFANTNVPGAVSNSRPMAAPVANGPTQEGLASPPALGTMTLSTNEIPLLPQQKDELVRSLRKGDVILEYFANPDNTVMVVEFTVVDIDKGAEEMEIVLQRTLKKGVQGDAVGKSDNHLRANDAKKKSESSGDLVFMYVRASGDQLADTLSESAKHPEIYRDIAPQMPIELPLNESTMLADGSVRNDPDKPGNTPVDTERQEAIEPQTVAAEATSVVQSFAKMNGIAVEDSSDRSANEKRNQEGLKQKFGVVVSKARSNSAPTLVANSADVSLSVDQSHLDVNSGQLDKTNQEGDDNSSGYAAIRVPVNLPRQPGQRQMVARNNRADQQPLNKNNNSFGGRNVQQRSSQSQQNGRDPRLMRMLIVLKSEQPATAP